jgi:hypothetical protein
VLLDENYEASILLIDEYWTRKNFDVAGDIVVFVPARNVVMVTGSEDEEGLRIASIVAQNGYDELGLRDLSLRLPERRQMAGSASSRSGFRPTR